MNMIGRMNSKYRKLHAVSLAAGCWLMLSACSSEDRLSADSGNEGKTPIELTVGIVGDNPSAASAKTRTIITTDNPYGRPAQPFGAATSLYMVIKGDNADGSGSKYTKAIGTVAENSNDVSFADGYKRYWEDGYARASKLSVYSACVPGKATALKVGGSTDYNTNTWSTGVITPSIDWPLIGVNGTAATQDANFLVNQDLCFSNNVSGGNRMVFDNTTKKFTKGDMIFHHALTKVTFKIVKGDGFTDDEFNSSVAIELKGFNTGGTLDISTGEFSSVTSTTDITSLADTKDNTTDAAYAHVRSCLMLPGSDLTGADAEALDKVNITINHNVYHIKKSQLKTALDGKTFPNKTDMSVLDGTKMRPGVHYVFTMKIGKKAIDNISAKIVDWETVTATAEPTNARITVSLLDNGEPQTGDAQFDLFRLSDNNNTGTFSDDFAAYNWGSGYVTSSSKTVNKAYLEEKTTDSGVYAAKEFDGTGDMASHPGWYWANNNTFYHFRTVKPKTNESWYVEYDAINGDYITLTRGTNEGYTDVCWGAPFNTLTNGTKLVYTPENGFDKKEGTDPNYTSSQISKAIGPTNDKILMEMFHMMSDVTIILKTSTGDNAVTLKDGANLATIKLSNIYPKGKVRMGNGKVEPDGTKGDVSPTLTYDETNKVAKVEHYGFVPQDLLNVVLTITTPDGNQYFQYMKDVVTSSSDYSNTLIAYPYTNNKITHWYPNFKYTYTFKLTKSDISLISATLANWETVEAGNDDVKIQ